MKLHTMQPEQGQQSPISQSVENNHNEPSSKTLVDRKQITGTPFWQIQDQNGWFIVMGDTRITPQFDTEEKLTQYFTYNHWDITCIVAGIMIEKYAKIHNLIKDIE